MRAAVIGATGFVGRALVPVLAQRGEVIAVSRRGAAPDIPGVHGLAADVTDSLHGALDGVDVVYHLVHSLGSRDFSDLDRRAAENVAAEAERAGVSQIVYLGGLGEDRAGLSAHLRAAWTRPPSSSPGPSRLPPCERPSSSAEAAPRSRPSSRSSTGSR